MDLRKTGSEEGGCGGRCGGGGHLDECEARGSKSVGGREGDVQRDMVMVVFFIFGRVIEPGIADGEIDFWAQGIIFDGDLWPLD